ncbi:MAG: hypothetical protein K2O88_06575 [Paramuribaculum sp.]|nr:hypothetical protein [Paramuribaculum sp.]
MRRIISIVLVMVGILVSSAADPTATNYSWEECQGSARPYPEPKEVVAYPDSLTPIMINHVGRHGARFAATPKHATLLLTALRDARDKGSITARGKELLALTEGMVNVVAGRWGALDSLGMAEQRGLASRMCKAYPELIEKRTVEAMSSYSPRCIMSMYEFTHQISRMNNKVEIFTSSGRQNSQLMRFFDLSDDYKELRSGSKLSEPVDEYSKKYVTMKPLRRVLGDKYQFQADSVDVAMAEYSVLAGLEAMNMHVDITKYFTKEEWNSLWGVFNFRQYMQRTASVVSSVPADIASPLLLDLINTTDKFLADSTSVAPIQLRFGHAETLMPLLSLMRLPGCYYLTNYFDTVGLHWKDFDVVPMAANLQLVLFKSKSGKIYVRCDLNEKPQRLIPNEENIYVEWNKARTYLERCIPIYY